MPDLTATLAFAALSAAIIAVPGPSVLFIVGRALTLGRRGALLTVVGNAGGALVQATLVAAGLGALVTSSIAVFTAVKLLGAAYLVWIGVRSLRDRAAVVHVPTAVAQVDSGEEFTSTAPIVEDRADVTGHGPSDRRVLREGFVVGVANPKLIVFFLAFLPQFVDPMRGRVLVQMAVLGGVFVAVALVLDSLWAIVAGSARVWLGARPERLVQMRVAGGVTLVGLGVHLAVTGRPD